MITWVCPLQMVNVSITPILESARKYFSCSNMDSCSNHQFHPISSNFFVVLMWLGTFHRGLHRCIVLHRCPVRGMRSLSSTSRRRSGGKTKQIWRISSLIVFLFYIHILYIYIHIYIYYYCIYIYDYIYIIPCIKINHIIGKLWHILYRDIFRWFRPQQFGGGTVFGTGPGEFSTVGFLQKRWEVWWWKGSAQVLGTPLNWYNFFIAIFKLHFWSIVWPQV